MGVILFHKDPPWHEQHGRVQKRQNNNTKDDGGTNVDDRRNVMVLSVSWLWTLWHVDPPPPPLLLLPHPPHPSSPRAYANSAPCLWRTHDNKCSDLIQEERKDSFVFTSQYTSCEAHRNAYGSYAMRNIITYMNIPYIRV